jgi:hypothetical protein
MYINVHSDTLGPHIARALEAARLSLNYGHRVKVKYKKIDLVPFVFTVTRSTEKVPMTVEAFADEVWNYYPFNVFKGVYSLWLEQHLNPSVDNGFMVYEVDVDAYSAIKALSKEYKQDESSDLREA